MRNGLDELDAALGIDEWAFLDECAKQDWLFTDDEIIDEVSRITLYDLFKCGVCGHPWEDHPTTCANYRRKNKCVYLRLRASKIINLKYIFEIARDNGWVEYHTFESWGSNKNPF